MTTFTVSLNDPYNLAGSMAGSVVDAMQKAADNWAYYLWGTGSIQIQVTIDPKQLPPTLASAAAATTVFKEFSGSRKVYDQGTAAEIEGQADPNNNTPDVFVTLSAAYLTN